MTLLLSACNQYDPYNPDKANLAGVWKIDNNTSRRADEKPIIQSLTVYPTHMEFCPGQGTVGTLGEWKDNGFWCQAKDGSGKIEAARIISPEEIELHLAAFFAGSSEIVKLYKERGSDGEMQVIQKTMADKYPPPITYPPPQGVISEGMTEYQLKALPWKADSAVPTEGDSKEDDGTVYSYHSDDPKLADLKVTVKNHKVIQVGGGNG